MEEIDREQLYEELSTKTQIQWEQSIKLLNHSIAKSLPAKKRKRTDVLSVEEEVDMLQQGAFAIQKYMVQRLDGCLDRFERKLNALMDVPEEIDVSRPLGKVEMKKESKDLDEQLGMLEKQHKKLDKELVKAASKYLVLCQESRYLDASLGMCGHSEPYLSKTHELVQEIRGRHSSTFEQLRGLENEYTKVHEQLGKFMEKPSVQRLGLGDHSTELLRKACLLLESV